MSILQKQGLQALFTIMETYGKDFDLWVEGAGDVLDNLLADLSQKARRTRRHNVEVLVMAAP